MVTSVMEKAFVGHEPKVVEKGGNSFFMRLLTRLIAAREAEARRKISQHLSNISDRRLIELGMSAREIELIRSKGRFNVELAG